MEGKPMKRKPLSIIAGLAVVGAIAAGGAAFTASNTIPDTVMGFGTSNITGAAANSLTYQRTGDGTHIVSATIVFAGDIHTRTVEGGFNTNALDTCDPGTFAAGETTVLCTMTTPEPTAGATTFNVAVS
jgi:hypothetical protein